MCMHKVKLLCLCSNCDYSQYCPREWAVILSGENLCPTSWNYCKWPDSAEEPLSHDPLRLTSFDPGGDRCPLPSMVGERRRISEFLRLGDFTCSSDLSLLSDVKCSTMPLRALDECRRSRPSRDDLRERRLATALRTRSWNSCMTSPYSSSLLATRALRARACLITRRWTSFSSLWEKIGKTITIFTYNQYRLSSRSKILQQNKIAYVNRRRIKCTQMMTHKTSFFIFDSNTMITIEWLYYSRKRSGIGDG